MRLFKKYDIERRDRQFIEAMGENTKYLDRPINGGTLSKYQIDEFKEDAYSKIENIREGFRKIQRHE